MENEPSGMALLMKSGKTFREILTEKDAEISGLFDECSRLANSQLNDRAILIEALELIIRGDVNATWAGSQCKEIAKDALSKIRR